MDQEVTVFVVEDDESMRELLSLLARSAGFAAEAYPGAAEFLGALEPSRPGCVITDLKMPGMDGQELLEELGRRQATLPVILVTGHGDIPAAVRAMEKGALAFLEKPVDEKALLAKIREAIGIDARRRAERAVHQKTQAMLAKLSPRERQIMGLVCDGFTNKEIARQLGLSPKTVEIHRSHVMMKLGISSVTDLVKIHLAHHTA